MVKDQKDPIEKTKNALKDLTEIGVFNIKVQCKPIGLEVIINATDPCDCVSLAGMVVSHLRRMNVEPEVLILP